MCDQTELKYVGGDIVWVKFHNFWWPGEVHGESQLPPDLLKSFRRKPVAVVKFFQENAYEYVKTINDIYRYNCIRKHEFIKKGLDLHRAKKPNMEMFPQDVRIAEERTGGDPNIINSAEFQPVQKPNIANIFGDQTPKLKKGFGRGRRRATPEKELTYSRVKNLNLKSAHATPTLTSPKSFASPSMAVNRSPIASSSTPNTNEFRCHLCNFSTTRLNVIVLHNKTHAAGSKPIETPTIAVKSAGKVKKTPPAEIVAKPPPKRRGRKPKPKLEEASSQEPSMSPPPPPLPPQSPPLTLDNEHESTSDEMPTPLTTVHQRKRGAPKKLTKTSPKKRQAKKSAIASVEIDEPKIVPELKPAAKDTEAAAPPPPPPGPRKRGRKKKVVAVVQTEVASEPEQPIEIKSKLLADWDEEDDDSVVSTSKEVASELEDIKSVVSSPAQSGDEKQPKAIRNIPKKDRRGINYGEFYVKPVLSTNETDTDSDQNAKNEATATESEDDACAQTKEPTKVSEIGSTTTEEEKSTAEDIEATKNSGSEESHEVVESTTTTIPADQTKAADVEPEEEKNEDDANLLKQSADLLEETSLLQKNIESVGVIQKKRRLQNKHKTDEDSEGTDNARNSSIDESAEESHPEPQVPEKPSNVAPPPPPSSQKQDDDDDKPRTRRRSSSKAQIITPSVTKTYRSSSRRKTKSTSGDEKAHLPNVQAKGNGLDANLTQINEEDAEIKCDENDGEVDQKSSIKMEMDENVADPNKIEVDCFDFKEEDEEMPQTLNRRKRRCLPPGKVFELETIDKLQEIRKKEENEKSKRIKLDPDTKETNLSSVDETKANSVDEVTSPEKSLAKEDDVKDSKALPPKERGKRIFKSRNRSRLSEGDSFSNDEKSPTKETNNQSFDSIEKSVADSTIESPKMIESASSTVKSDTDIELPTSESMATDDPINSTVKMDDSQIESEVANTLITLTNSPAKMTESIVTSSEKVASSSDSPTPTTQHDEPKPMEESEATSSRAVQLETIHTNDKELAKAKESSVINAPTAKKRNSINEIADANRDIETVAVQSPKLLNKGGVVVETSASNANKRVIVAESSGPVRDAGDGLLIKSNPLKAIASTTAPTAAVAKPKPPQPSTVVKPPPTTVKTTTKVVIQSIEQSAVSSTSTSPQQKIVQKPIKNPPKGKKVPVTIGYDLQGNAIVTYRTPSTRPVVHLPSHIQTPELLNTKSNSSTQFVITSKGALLKTTSHATVSQTPTTAVTQQRPQVVRQNASTSYTQKIKSPPLSMQSIHVPTQQSINPNLLHKPSSAIHKANQQQQQQMRKNPFIQQQPQHMQKQTISTNRATIQHTQQMVQKQNASVKAASKKQQQMKKQQQEMLMRKQQESVIMAHHQQAAAPAEVQPTEMLQNVEDNQLLAVPAENFDGPSGAFYLCKYTDNNEYIPIDSQPLYLDEKNQLIPGNLINAVIQEELIEEPPEVSQQFEYPQEQIVQNVDEPSNLKYLLNVDGQQILLDQQSLLQLTSGGEMQQLVTADGQRLILQGSPQDILAAIQSSQQEQIILPNDIIEEDPSNHDILAAALEDTGVFPQEQYIGGAGGVLQIQTGNGIETVDPLAFQTINQAPTSATNAILSTPIMSTLEQPSKGDVVSSPRVIDSNLDESLAVIGVSAPSTNVPASLELPITVTNPAIAPKTTNAIATIYPSNLASTLPPQALQTNQLSPITSDILSATPMPISSSGIVKLDTNNIGGDATTTMMIVHQDDEQCEIVPNTPESVINHGFTSDNSNSSEIPLQTNLILRPPSIDAMEKDEIDNGNDVDRRQQQQQQQQRRQRRNIQQQITNSNHNAQYQYHTEQTEPNSRTDVDSLILNENSFDHHDAALLLANSRPGFQAITIDNDHDTDAAQTNNNRNSRRNRHRHRITNNFSQTETAPTAAVVSNDVADQPIFIIEQHIMENSEYDTDDVSNVEHFNS